jgi:hypothetical protein
MSVATVPVQQATIRQYAKDLKLATVGGQFLSSSLLQEHHKNLTQGANADIARDGARRAGFEENIR